MLHIMHSDGFVTSIMECRRRKNAMPFQGLLDNGFVCYKEIVPNDAVKGKRTTAQSYILIHTLVARFLDSILSSSHQVELDDGGRG